MFLDSTFAKLCRVPVIEKQLWRWLYNYLATRPGDDAWEFMNYGYASGPEALGGDGCLRLYDELAGQVPLTGRRLLEVGCGRGGGIRHLRQHHDLAGATGCDLSPAAIALCKTRPAARQIDWIVADAEALPFDDASFDIVINVESSHCYPRFGQFVAEVHRVLSHGGTFLWTDFRATDRVKAVRETFRTAGFEEVIWRDVTDEVLTSMAIEEPRKEALLQERVPSWLRDSFRDFAGMLGSKIHQSFVSRRWTYSMAVLRKA